MMKDCAPNLFVILVCIQIPDVKYTIAVEDYPPTERTISVNATHAGTGFAVTKHDILTSKHAITMDLPKLIENEIVKELTSSEQYSRMLSKVKILKISTEKYMRNILVMHPEWQEPVKIHSIEEKEGLVWLHADREMDIENPLGASTAEPVLGDIVYAVGYPDYRESLLNTEQDAEGVLDDVRKMSIISNLGFVKQKGSIYMQRDGNLYAHNVKIDSGSDGGPLLDENGNVIGISIVLDEISNENFSISIQEVKKAFPVLWEEIRRFNQLESDGREE